MRKLAILLFFFISINSYSNNIVSIEKQEKEIYSLLSDLEISEDTTLEIVFGISSSNEIIIKRVICRDINIESQVLEKLDHKQINGNGIELRNIKMKFLLKNSVETFTIY